MFFFCRQSSPPQPGGADWGQKNTGVWEKGFLCHLLSTCFKPWYLVRRLSSFVAFRRRGGGGKLFAQFSKMTSHHWGKGGWAIISSEGRVFWIIPTYLTYIFASGKYSLYGGLDRRGALSQKNTLALCQGPEIVCFHIFIIFWRYTRYQMLKRKIIALQNW